MVCAGIQDCAATYSANRAYCPSVTVTVTVTEENDVEEKEES
jgi:hypothetical protein